MVQSTWRPQYKPISSTAAMHLSTRQWAECVMEDSINVWVCYLNPLGTMQHLQLKCVRLALFEMPSQSSNCSLNTYVEPCLNDHHKETPRGLKAREVNEHGTKSCRDAKLYLSGVQWQLLASGLLQQQQQCLVAALLQHHFPGGHLQPCLLMSCSRQQSCSLLH